MITNGLTTPAGTYTGPTSRTTRSTASAKAKETSSVNKTSESAESKLSAKAQKFLNELRDINDDFDFIIAGSDDDKRALVEGSDKEFSVVLSTEEMERMANDEKYAMDKINTIRTVVEMSDRINQQFGFSGAEGAAADGSNSDVFSKFSVDINDDGSMTLFADLEKISAKQKERIEESKEKAEAEKANAQKAAENDETSVKKIRLTAKTEAELIDKISKIDWDKIPAEVPEPGSRFDMSV